MKKNTNVLEYRGYIAELSLDLEDNIIVGKVINTTDIISFHGKTLDEAKQAFQDVLDTYIEVAEKEGIELARPYSGKFNLRITPTLHRKLTVLAKKQNKSLNECTEELIASGLKTYLDSHNEYI